MAYSSLCLRFLFGLIAILGTESATTSRQKRAMCASTKACLTPFPMLEEFVAKDNIKGLFPVSYGVVLDQVCGQKVALHRCLNNARCSDVEIAYLGTGVKQTLDYICGDGREKLLSESKCFARDSFERGFKMCAKAVESEITLASVNVQLGHQSQSAYCPIFTKYFECVENEVKNSCSYTAADFVTTLTAKVFEPLVTQVGCSITY